MGRRPHAAEDLGRGPPAPLRAGGAGRAGKDGPGSYNPTMPPRFFAPALAGLDAPVPLPDGEAAHLSRVLRLTAGDTVAVFDGRGTEYLARVERAGRGRAVVRPYERPRRC